MKKFLTVFAALALCLSTMAQEYGVVNISVCNMLEEPQYGSSLSSQALLGMPVKIVGQGGEYGWPEVQTPDGYTGWVHKDAVVPMDSVAFQAWQTAPKLVVTALESSVYERPSVSGTTVSDLVVSDRLLLLGKNCSFYHVAFPDGRTGYVPKADAMPLDQWRDTRNTDPEAILASALKLKGRPYLWGGTSVRGMDCSGFVRTVLLMHGIIIPRDAGPQSRASVRIDAKEDLHPGDLVFFGRMAEDGPHVAHVGFYLGDGRFIHSLGYVKVGSFRADDPLYDAYNTGRYLFGGKWTPQEPLFDY